MLSDRLSPGPRIESGAGFAGTRAGSITSESGTTGRWETVGFIIPAEAGIQQER